MESTILQIAGAVLTLFGIATVGYKIGEKLGDRTAAATRDKDLIDAKTLTEAARSQADAFREEALRWKNRCSELSGSTLSQNKLAEIRAKIDNPTSVWFKTPIDRPQPAEARPVLLVANLKGGVGKSTISTHLAAQFGFDEKRVLFIDLDFQGSGSTFLLTDAKRIDIVSEGNRERAGSFLNYQENAEILKVLPVPLGDATPNVRVLSSHHELGNLEEKLLLRWLIGDEPEDIRYNLARNIQSKVFDWDLVVIDAPPRMSTAMVQAIVASTHILIPTQLEAKSVEAVSYFLGQLQSLAEKAVCSPNVIGVLPNMVDGRINYGEARTDLLRQVSQKFGGGERVWTDIELPVLASFQRLPLVQKLSSAEGSPAQKAIRKVADRVKERIWP